MNPIEHIWAYMKMCLRGKGKLNKKNLKEEIVRIWNSITPEMVRPYILSFHKRVLAVYQAKGKNTTY
ncbi:hypothetical protein A0H76_2364 [Hepatospora eriocheir]|uniref:TCB2 n=1 Tax=Hepatospora eriocheir TaxID=1081669 RepID=A0A1X0QFF5_9MICR|nr:hypothetical protein A0H76_2364 [Hepatospora eriocheir]